MRAKKKFCISRNFSRLCLENCSAVSKLFPPNNQSVSTTATLKMGFSGVGGGDTGLRGTDLISSTHRRSAWQGSLELSVIYTAISLAFLKIIRRA